MSLSIGGGGRSGAGLQSRLCGVGGRSSMMLQGEGEPARLGNLLPETALALAGEPGPLSIHGHRRSDVMSRQPGT
jgi:hypothetical protein